MAEQGRIAPRLRLCRGCKQFVIPGRPDCVFCGGDLDALEADHDTRIADMHRAADALRAALAREPDAPDV